MAKRIVERVLLSNILLFAGAGESCPYKMGRRHAIATKRLSELGPAVRCVSNLKALNGFLIDAAILQIFPCVGAVGRDQLLSKEGIAGGHHAIICFFAPSFLCLALGIRSFETRELYIGTRRERFYRLHEAHAGVLGHKLDGIARRMAPKAIIETSIIANAKGRRSLGVKGTKAFGAISAAVPPQTHVFANQLREPNAVFYLLNDFSGNGHPNSTGAEQRFICQRFCYIET